MQTGADRSFYTSKCHFALALPVHVTGRVWAKVCCALTPSHWALVLQIFERMDQQSVEADAALCANALEASVSTPASLQTLALPQRTLRSARAQLRRMRETLRSSRRDSEQVALKKAQVRDGFRVI